MGLNLSADQIINSDRFKELVRKRWNISIILTVLLFVMYYGYILIVAYGKSFLITKVGINTNWGIILGVGVIILSWGLTAAYVVWANNVYDPEVKALVNDLVKEK